MIWPRPLPIAPQPDEGAAAWLAWNERVTTIMLRRERLAWWFISFFVGWITFNLYWHSGALRWFYAVMLLSQCYSVMCVLKMRRARFGLLALMASWRAVIQRRRE